MPVRVNIVGHAREIFDRPAYSFEAKPGMTVGDVLKELSGHAGPGYGEQVYDAASGRVNEHLAIFVNAREIRALEGPATKLKEGDIITILPPMAGG